MLNKLNQKQLFDELYLLQNCELAMGAFDQELATQCPEERFFWEEAVSEISRVYYDVIVLDELNVVLSHELLPLEPVLRGLKDRPAGLHIVVTGRNAPEELIEIADLVTEMKQVKHPFQDQGIKAQKGIEF